MELPLKFVKEFQEKKISKNSPKRSLLCPGNPEGLSAGISLQVPSRILERTSEGILEDFLTNFVSDFRKIYLEGASLEISEESFQTTNR